MKKFFAEFKEFAMRGNVVDMAVGVVIGAAFKAIIDALVNNIINPAIGVFFKTDFSNLGIELVPAVETVAADGTVTVEQEAVVLGYGMLLTAIINFILVALALFVLVKFINKLHKLGKKEEAPVEEAPTTKKCPYCCTDIAIEAVKCPHCTSDQPTETE